MVVSEGDYVLILCLINWCLELIEFLFILMIENIDVVYVLFEKGLVGNYVVFDFVVLDVFLIND